MGNQKIIAFFKQMFFLLLNILQPRERRGILFGGLFTLCPLKKYKEYGLLFENSSWDSLFYFWPIINKHIHSREPTHENGLLLFHRGHHVMVRTHRKPLLYFSPEPSQGWPWTHQQGQEHHPTLVAKELFAICEFVGQTGTDDNWTSWFTLCFSCLSVPGTYEQ